MLAQALLETPIPLSDPAPPWVPTLLPPADSVSGATRAALRSAVPGRERERERDWDRGRPNHTGSAPDSPDPERELGRERGRGRSATSTGDGGGDDSEASGGSGGDDGLGGGGVGGGGGGGSGSRGRSVSGSGGGGDGGRSVSGLSARAAEAAELAGYVPSPRRKFPFLHRRGGKAGGVVGKGALAGGHGGADA